MAIGVVAISIVALTTSQAWLLIVLAYGFTARVLAGPKISPLGRLAVSIAAPAIAKSRQFSHWVRFVPGPPKRFAQAIGAFMTCSAVALWLSIGWNDARWMLIPLIIAASLEGFAGYCVGCTIFGWLIRRGLVPASICDECGDLASRRRRLDVAREADRSTAN